MCTVRVVRRVGGESGETQHWELGEYKHGDPGVHVRRKLHNADEKVFIWMLAFSLRAGGSCVRSISTKFACKVYVVKQTCTTPN